LIWLFYQTIALFKVETNSLHLAVKKLAGDIPDAYSYIFDAEEQRFIYASSQNSQLESAIIELDTEKGLATLVDQAVEKMIQMPCKNNERVFFIKRMATNLYFGMCVLKDTPTVQAAKNVMKSAFQVQAD
jgi:hypothetical protein